MTQPRFSFVPVMDHEVHVTEWGEPGNKPLVMWHGLARTGRDFDELASALSDEYYVICPDTIGRGLSSWSSDPEVEYSLQYYAGIASDLLDHYEMEQVDWLGTSMGGLIGMRLASGPFANRLKTLVMNDIGPEVPEDAIERILTYTNQVPEFETLAEVDAWLRQVYAPFGRANDAFWTRMTRSSVRRLSNGRLTLHFDPNITVQFSASREELTVWDRFEKIEIPIHVIRGVQSDILTRPIVERMVSIKPNLSLTELQGHGHAPALCREEDSKLMRELLSKA